MSATAAMVTSTPFLSGGIRTSEAPKSFRGRKNISPGIYNSLTLDHHHHDSVSAGEKAMGSEVRVKRSVKVYHVPKVGEMDLKGKVGVLKQYVGSYKGKRISANLPYQIEFSADDVVGRNGKPVKFVAHLREDEFELVMLED